MSTNLEMPFVLAQMSHQGVQCEVFNFDGRDAVSSSVLLFESSSCYSLVGLDSWLRKSSCVLAEQTQMCPIFTPSTLLQIWSRSLARS